MELTVLQLAIIGAVASFLAAVIRLVTAKFFGGKVLSRGTVTVIAYLVSAGLAFAFKFQDLPVFGPDLAENVNLVVTYVTALFGAATLVYNIVLATVLDKLGMSSEKLLAKYGPPVQELTPGAGFRG
jgi:hypothetical protein